MAQKKRRARTPDDRMLAQISRNFNTSREVLGERAVQCYVSNRWLAFPPNSEVMEDGQDLMIVDVMTSTPEGDARKLCELILVRSDLERALSSVKSRPFDPERYKERE